MRTFGKALRTCSIQDHAFLRHFSREIFSVFPAHEKPSFESKILRQNFSKAGTFLRILLKSPAFTNPQTQSNLLRLFFPLRIYVVAKEMFWNVAVLRKGPAKEPSRIFEIQAR